MENIKPVIHILSLLLVLLSIFMTLPVILLANGDHSDWKAFVISASAVLSIALVGLFLSRNQNGMLKQKQMFLLTVGSWVLISGLASLPLLLSDLDLSMTDAVFESVSGVTSTGSTVLTGLDDMPGDILVWRSIIQWIGGIGIIGMAVAILPFLRVGGMRLFATESSDWSEKALPRTITLGRGLIASYVGLTTLCILAYWLAGMNLFDAFNHGLTTVSTGGYSTSDASMGKFDSDLLLLIATLFMALGALPFFLYVRMLNGQYQALWRDEQVQAFFKILIGVSLALTIHGVWSQQNDVWGSFVASIFNVTSIVTTTGFASEDYTVWGPLAVAVFFFLTFVGGCSGSTSGGMKVFRFQLSFIMLREQITRLLHPRAVLSRRYNRRLISDDIIASSIAFSFMFFVTFAFIALALAGLGLDLTTSLTGAATAVANVGPGLGEIIGPAGNFQALPDAAKWVLCVGMLLGRLELLSVLVLLTADFWRK
ncbi:TrkH family potassium uptake protein [Hydrocarboniclastica marina]|uniref:TrkH family potassium uptake protein n=1 Tax=Hydrocarboniclastica marina TaxID=2259620 RepID=UPI0015629B10|nr:TrkH family potassium uptake protein [Hydrocarboniclastica marina]